MGGRADFQIDLFAKLCVIDLFAKAASIDFFAAPHAEILEKIGEYKQKDAIVRTRGFDGAWR